MPYIGKSPHFGVRNRFIYTATAGNTSKSGADDNGATLTFTDGAYVDVYLNGALLKPDTDYVTTTANTIGSIAAMSADDILEVIVYDVFSVSDTVSAASGGTFSAGVNIDGGVVVNESSADVDFRVESNGQTHKLFVDGGNDVVCLGLSTPETIGGQMPGLQIEGTDYKGGQVSVWRNANDDAGAYLILGKSRGTALNSDTIVQSGDDVGIINFIGADGTDRAHPQASIRASADGTQGENDVPGKLRFMTTADGGTTLTERMTIDSAGIHIMKGAVNSYVSQTRNTIGSGNVFMHLWRMTTAPDDTTSMFLVCDDGDGSTSRMKINSEGDILTHDGTAVASLSDERIKQDITDANSQWDDIKAIKIRNFKRKDDVRQYGDKAKVQLGVIAQEIEKTSPKLVKENSPDVGDILSSDEFGTLEDDTDNPIYYVDGDTIPNGKKVGDVKGYNKKVKEQKTTVKSVIYSILYMKAVKALQEAMARIETLEAKVKALEDA